jgi:5-hydroxyisourate hydrolase-like protein (transthyretin family)
VGVLLLLLGAGLASPALAQTLTVQNGGTITVSNGSVWDLNGTSVDLGSTGSTASINETSGGRFAGGMLTATRDLNAPSAQNVAGLGAIISASSSLGPTTIARGHTVQTGGGNTSVARYFDITPGNNSGLDATLTFAYADGELNGLTESTLEFFSSTDGGSSWTERGQTSRDATANTVTLDDISSFSRWTLGSEDAPLPVELAQFSGTQTDASTVELTWSTAAEQNNAGFRVQHKASEDDTWQKIGFVESKADGGTTSDSRTYQFSAEDLSAGTHQFRLKQVDLDGTPHPHKAIPVEVQMQQPLRLSTPAPHPVQSQATLSFAVKEKQKTTLRLYNTLGQRVATLYRGTPTAGETQTAQLSATDLTSGTYFLRLQTGDRTRTQRVTVVR